MIENFNDAAELVAEQAGGCSICHDTLGDDGVSAKLAMIILPDCKHCFHEVCIMQWLNPIKLPSTDHASTTGTTSISGSVPQVSSDTPSTTDDDNHLPQQIASQATQNFIQEVAGAMQHIMDRLDDDERREISDEEERSPRHRATQRARELVGRLASRDVEQIRVTVREINEQGVRILSEDRGLDDILGDDQDNSVDNLEEDLEAGENRDEQPTIIPSSPHAALDDDVVLEDLFDGDEEGEIHDEQPAILPSIPYTVPARPADSDSASQYLPPIDLFRESFLNLEGLPRISRTEGRTQNCPMCRGCAFGQKSPCHADTLQLLRVRLRLTDLAYDFFRYERNVDEQSNRAEVAVFLNRRYCDNMTLGEPEILPCPQECRKLFKEARQILRVAAYRYMRIQPLSAAEQLRVMQLAMFFESFELKDDMISYFFDPKPHEHGPGWKIHLPPRELYDDPKGFFSRIRFEQVSEGSDPSFPIQVNADDEMPDALADL
ncbi:MAG: hypothetical protein LQ343_002685 [Gyalolechia ehrenbergii]|nr:MAG: hypothetical protein LQ343_002685 [Gyalolechia ehrenbergii]